MRPSGEDQRQAGFTVLLERGTDEVVVHEGLRLLSEVEAVDRTPCAASQFKVAGEPRQLGIDDRAAHAR